MSEQGGSSLTGEDSKQVLMVESRNYMCFKPSNKKRMIEVKRPVYDFALDDFSIFGQGSDDDLKNNTTWAFHTALCYIPPESMWDSVQDIRQEIDKGMERWPPHVNLLFPFIPETCFDAACKLLTQELQDFPPFECSFNSVSYFEKGASVLWIDQDETARQQFIQLQKRVANLFPYCDKKKNDSGDFIPHMTVGYTPKTNLKRVHTQLSEDWKTQTCTVGEICMIYRPDMDTCFKTIHKIPLGGM